MKPIFTFIFVLGFSISLIAQEVESSRTYKVMSPFALEDYNTKSKKASYNGKTTIPGTFITLFKELPDHVIIIVNEFDESLETLREEYNFSTSSGQVYFRATKEDFNAGCVKVFNTWRPIMLIGTAVVPVRVRPEPNDFSKDISIGPSIGLKFRMIRTLPVYLNLLYSLEISSVSLNQDNTFQASNPTVPIDEVTNASALTHAGGIVLENASLQFGFFFGWDRLGNSNRKKYEWVYDKLPWYSLGFGINLFANQNKARLTYTIDNKNIGRKKVRTAITTRNVQLSR